MPKQLLNAAPDGRALVPQYSDFIVQPFDLLAQTPHQRDRLLDAVLKPGERIALVLESSSFIGHGYLAGSGEG
jgi:hypothetical protein